MGRNTETVRLYVKPRGQKRYRRVGGTAMHLDGLREILAAGLYGLSQKYLRGFVSVRGTADVCSGKGRRGALYQVRIAEKFVGKRTQTFIPRWAYGTRTETFMKTKRLCG